jgi:thioredoxin 2
MGDAPAARIVTCPQCGKRNRVKSAAAGYPHCQNCGAPLPWVVDVDDAGFREVVLQASLPALVDFWAPWCGPCRVVSPIVERLAGTLAGKMKVAKLNTDASPATANQYGIRGIPTLVLLQDGKEIDRITGAMPESALRPWLEQRVQKASSPAASESTTGERR